MTKFFAAIKDKWPAATGGFLVGAVLAAAVGGDLTSFGTDRQPPDTIVPAQLNHEAQVIEVVKRASPAVVSIVIAKDVPILERYYEESPNPLPDFFGNDFFGQFPFEFRVPQLRQRGTERREVGGGTGFFVSSGGLIVTNKHVVADASASYTVLTNEGEKYPVEIVAADPLLDLAVVQVKGGNGRFPYLVFEDAPIGVGQTAIAIGNALGEFRNTVSVGVVSGLARSVIASDARGQAELLEEVIQTDAAINPGNSGGPLLGLRGKIIGINVAVARDSENIGFALPANVVKNAVESVKAHGKILRAWLGIRYVSITPQLKERNKLSVDYGVLIVRGDDPNDLAVVPGSPADKAGLRENDIILEVDGVKLDRERSLASVIRQKKPGDTITLKVLQQGEEKTIRVILETAE